MAPKPSGGSTGAIVPPQTACKTFTRHSSGASNHTKINIGRSFDPDHTGELTALPQTTYLVGGGGWPRLQELNSPLRPFWPQASSLAVPSPPSQSLWIRPGKASKSQMLNCTVTLQNSETDEPGSAGHSKLCIATLMQVCTTHDNDTSVKLSTSGLTSLRTIGGKMKTARGEEGGCRGTETP